MFSLFRIAKHEIKNKASDKEPKVELPLAGMLTSNKPELLSNKRFLFYYYYYNLIQTFLHM